MQLGQAHIDEFQFNGFVAIPGLYEPSDINAVQSGIYAIIGQVMARQRIADTRSGFATGEFDTGYLDRDRGNRQWGREVWEVDVCRPLRPVIDMAKTITKGDPR
jgi:hypothetical protein